jgi:hypothetical protein
MIYIVFKDPIDTHQRPLRGGNLKEGESTIGEQGDPREDHGHANLAFSQAKQWPWMTAE